MSATNSVLTGAKQNDVRRATLGFTLPFAVFIAAMAAERWVGVSGAALYAARLSLVAAAILGFSWPYLDLRPSFPIRSLVIGVAVFCIWIAPDLLFGYRHSVVFENVITGQAVSSVPLALRKNTLFIVLRTISCTVAVPILEELFWRGWLMRWLVDKDFLKVGFGLYAPSAFWVVAVLFASEHGPYWEVGLAAGIIYNWWAIRSKSLADCILAHAVTNGCLSAYVLVTGLWRYWL